MFLPVPLSKTGQKRISVSRTLAYVIQVPAAHSVFQCTCAFSISSFRSGSSFTDIGSRSCQIRAEHGPVAPSLTRRFRTWWSQFPNACTPGMLTSARGSDWRCRLCTSGVEASSLSHSSRPTLRCCFPRVFLENLVVRCSDVHGARAHHKTWVAPHHKDTSVGWYGLLTSTATKSSTQSGVPSHDATARLRRVSLGRGTLALTLVRTAENASTSSKSEKGVPVMTPRFAHSTASASSKVA